MDLQPLGRVVVVVGAVLVVVGLLLSFGGGKYLSWLGRLPGDIRIEGEHSRFYFPLMSSIVISILLSLIVYIISRLR